DEARREPVRFHGVGIRNQRIAGEIVGENPIEYQSALLCEVVITEAGGEVQLRTDRVRRFAEQRALFQVVVQIGPEQVILGSPESRGKSIRGAQDWRGGGVEPDVAEVLAVVARVLAVETADDPTQTNRGAGLTQLPRP